MLDISPPIVLQEPNFPTLNTLNDTNIADVAIKREIESVFDSRILMYVEENLRIFEKERESIKEYKITIMSNVKCL